MNVLFLCTGNSCRSQMAEGWAKHHRHREWHVESAGLLAKGIDPRAAQVMLERGVDISSQRSKTMDELPEDMNYDLVVTVCDNAKTQCPALPGTHSKVHHAFEDPPSLAVGELNDEVALEHYRRVRDQIQTFILELAV
jgi:arsenate reductase